MPSPITTATLRHGYALGYFPWPDASGQITWHRPEPRAILPLGELYCSRRLARRLKQGTFTFSVDRAFRDVMAGCADRPRSWVTPEIQSVYGQLHDEGDAHSVEVWRDGRLAGGLYGVSLGGAFFAESMFHRETDASKAALVHLDARLRARGFELCDIQVLTAHTASLGGQEISSEEFLARLARATALAVTFVDR